MIERKPDKIYQFAAIKAIEIQLRSATIDVGKEALFFLGTRTVSCSLVWSKSMSRLSGAAPLAGRAPTDRFLS